MIKSLLYYIALLLFVIYNCNTPVSSLRSFIPPSVGKYLLGFPAFIVVTTILVVYPILTGKEFNLFKTETTSTNIFQPDTADSVNRATVVIDDSGEIVLEKSSDVNQKFSNLVSSLKNDLNQVKEDNNKIHEALKNTNNRIIEVNKLSLNNDSQFANSNRNPLYFEFALPTWCSGRDYQNNAGCAANHGRTQRPGYRANNRAESCRGACKEFDLNCPGSYPYKVLVHKGYHADTRDGDGWMCARLVHGRSGNSTPSAIVSTGGVGSSTPNDMKTSWNTINDYTDSNFYPTA